MRTKAYPTYKDSGIDRIGKVPAHWAIRKATWLFAIGSGTTPSSENPAYYNGDIHWITTSELRESVVGATAKMITKKAQIDYSSLRLHPKGSIAVAMYGATIGRLGILGVPATVNQACCVFSAPCGVVMQFWFYWLQMRRTFLVSLGYGGGQPNLSQELLRSIRAPIPTELEQQVIADFLDRETAKIDALVEKKERLIELLKEKRTALITHAVTRGLDSNVRMKDSGIEWLGQIPAHWNPGRIGIFSQQVTDGAHISPDTASPDHPFVSTVDIVGGRIDFENCLGTTSETYAYMVRTGCRPRRGDVLFSKDGTVGRTTVVDSDAEFVVASSLVIISPRKEVVMPRHLDYWLNGTFIQELVELFLSGAALRRISVAKVGNLPIALPPLNEQQAIVDFLDRETAKIDALVSKIQEAIERLKEYRTALISAAVTGKIDVRNTPS